MQEGYQASGAAGCWAYSGAPQHFYPNGYYPAAQHHGYGDYPAPPPPPPPAPAAVPAPPLNPVEVTALWGYKAGSPAPSLPCLEGGGVMSVPRLGPEHRRGVRGGKCVSCGRLVQPAAVRCAACVVQPSPPPSSSSDTASTAGGSEGGLWWEEEASQCGAAPSPRTLRRRLLGILNRVSPASYPTHLAAVAEVIAAGGAASYPVLSELVAEQASLSHACSSLLSRMTRDLGPTFRRHLLGRLREDFQAVLSKAAGVASGEGMMGFIKDLHREGVLGVHTLRTCLAGLLSEAKDALGAGNPEPKHLDYFILLFPAANREESASYVHELQGLMPALCLRQRFAVERVLEGL